MSHIQRAFIFPGLGSQHVGMGMELAKTYQAARDVFNEVDSAVKETLSMTMFFGPLEKLLMAENALPATFAVSMATIRVLEQHYGIRPGEACRFVAGHSVGEYAALCAARSVRLGDIARILKKNGRYMQQADGKGGMTALLGLNFDKAKRITEKASMPHKDEVCVVAADNCPGQVVISGHRDAIDRAIGIRLDDQEYEHRRIPVTLPMHSPMMGFARPRLQRSFRSIPVKEPKIAFISNLKAERVDNPVEIRKLMGQQLTSYVRWHDTMRYMVGQGVTAFVECGAGRMLASMAKRVDRSLSTVSLREPADIENFAKMLARPAMERPVDYPEPAAA